MSNEFVNLTGQPTTPPTDDDYMTVTPSIQPYPRIPKDPAMAELRSQMIDLTGQPGSLNYNPAKDLPAQSRAGNHAFSEANGHQQGNGGVQGQTPLPDRSPITDYRSPTPPPTTHNPPPTPLRGWVNAYYIKVGGKRLGPYYARRWKEGGKLRKEYVAEQDVERTKLACELYREKTRRGREIDRIFTTVVGNLDFLWRAMMRSTKGIHLRPDEMEHLARLETEGIKAEGRPPRRLPPTAQEVDELVSKIQNRKSKIGFMVPFFQNHHLSLPSHPFPLREERAEGESAGRPIGGEFGGEGGLGVNRRAHKNQEQQPTKEKENSPAQRPRPKAQPPAPNPKSKIKNRKSNALPPRP